MIRNAKSKDKKYFAELILISAPYFPLLFGKKIKSILEDLFCYEHNLFSFKHTLCAKIKNSIAGIALGYDWKIKKQKDIITGLLLFKNMKIEMLKKIIVFIRFNNTIGKLNKFEYYISNISVYDKYRRMGIGKKLIHSCEQKAKKSGAKRIILDVESNNINAISIYKKLNYKYLKRFSILLQDNKKLYFIRMIKNIQ